jgi:drug/metabolite transporter (DMT)-like permease
MKHAKTVGIDPLGYLLAMLNPFVAGGIIFLILWLLLRMALLSWADLSFATPVTGLGYVLAAILGRIFLAEAISPEHWAGTILIFAGVALVGITRDKTVGSVVE